jgi:hemoglobin/transferrin/lactoferrin receptor protein
MQYGIMARKNGRCIMRRLDVSHSTYLFDKVNLLVGFQDYTESRHERGLYEELLRHRQENLQAFSGILRFCKKGR